LAFLVTLQLPFEASVFGNRLIIKINILSGRRLVISGSADRYSMMVSLQALENFPDLIECHPGVMRDKYIPLAYVADLSPFLAPWPYQGEASLCRQAT
jgi:hypothetical protein